MNRIIGIWTQAHHLNQKKPTIREMELYYYFTYHDTLDDIYLHLMQGPTGYESISLKGLQEVIKENKRNWTACAGTFNKYAKLEISPEQLRIAYEDFEHLIKRGVKYL